MIYEFCDSRYYVISNTFIAIKNYSPAWRRPNMTARNPYPNWKIRTVPSMTLDIITEAKAYMSTITIRYYPTNLSQQRKQCFSGSQVNRLSRHFTILTCFYPYHEAILVRWKSIIQVRRRQHWDALHVFRNLGKRLTWRYKVIPQFFEKFHDTFPRGEWKWQKQLQQFRVTA